MISDAIPGEITAEYDVGQTLGTGHFSKVKLGTHKVTGEKVAIKVRCMLGADVSDWMRGRERAARLPGVVL